jgi:hypothetical protein
MYIDVIENFQTFTQIRKNWDAVYEADPEAQFFLSWIWLSGWLKGVDTKSQWFILAAKPDGDAPAYVAFFPLRLRFKSTKAGRQYNEITMAGNRKADYTGLICIPAFQDQAIPAFARYIKQLNWAILNLEFFCASDERTRLFLQHFPQREFAIAEIEQINKRDGINNCICPHVKLPSDWESYLNTNLSSNTRQKVRRFLRKIDNSSEFRITHSTADTIEQDVEILLRFWVLKWGDRKGDGLASIQNINRVMLAIAFEDARYFYPSCGKERPRSEHWRA